MYGLVNKAIQEMVCDHYGAETWKAIKTIAETEADNFISLESYPDDLTHRLVKSASQVLQRSTADIMEDFGKYWVEFTGQEGYGEMMDLAGNDLPEFLDNLDDLHSRLGVIFPKMQPPSFQCSDQQLNTLNLHYYSHRQGMAPMVSGLLEGLGERFTTCVEVTQTQDREQGADHDVFSVTYQR
ncbi:heme NO-binding domain-containing protein [Acaryochloris sp. IP29b_bin.148]|uniref:heme NO-binding domain-containing protein n=1 Tax=Acaryochloris sp. IP29b_bin.148 TaxID=2969218 RepID=UPI0026372C8A|nr:heme NO-binding domain-containing protein [Acaryochloris sp. IP29b_bin.148]